MQQILKKASLALLLSVSACAVAAAAEGKAAETQLRAQSLASRPHWAYQPVQDPAIPHVKQQDWLRTPVDAFVLAKMEAKRVQPSPEVDRGAFIRRATLDVWGLIPTPEEVAAFVNDASPDAYEKLVDRLLASPRYGERQARRWLDLVRYADSAGFQNDQTRPNIYRYRDYVINSFNTDKPYSRFIEEQIAGDELAPGNQEALTATGFLALYPDNSNSRDLVQKKYQITTDITDTIGTAILGSTVACGRCHNHKSDKFTQKDYYSLQAFFANTAISEKFPAATGEAELQYQAARDKYDAAVKPIRAERKAIIDSVRDKALDNYVGRYLPDSRESYYKPKDQWNALDRWVNHRFDIVLTDALLSTYLRYMSEGMKDAKDYDPSYGEKWQRYRKLGEEQRKFDKLRPTKGSDTVTGATELGHSDAPPTYVFFGGNHERPLEEVQPAFPEAYANEKPDIKPTATSSGRRLALAKWLGSETNPLTARVYVNRVWNEYFGKGIVVTVSDFGRAGDRPTNPELLDYLAHKFVSDGWSVKKLHREILLSSVYRQSSAPREEIASADPDNKLLAVFPRKRLDAEQIRDSLLAAAGRLDDTVGGPSVFPPVPANLNAGAFWEVSRDQQDFNRRSLYIFTRRSVPYPMLENFDMASAQQAHSQRDVTTTPLQALTLINNDVVFQWSQALAGRVIREAGSDESAQLDRLYEILFARKPDEVEKALLDAFLDRHVKVIADKAAGDKPSIALPVAAGIKVADPLRASAFVDLVHTVVNSNEFIYRF
jgi:Protein of unknown function (DUF1553)/Protein of unknown function (DUF1549)